MEYKNFCEALASYQSPNFSYDEEGKPKTEETASQVIEQIADFCAKLDTIREAEALARIVCKYSLEAKDPGEKKLAEEGAEALAQIIHFNANMDLYAEAIERMAQASIIINRKID